LIENCRFGPFQDAGDDVANSLFATPLSQRDHHRKEGMKG
jgi:hypothetical protein